MSAWHRDYPGIRSRQNWICATLFFIALGVAATPAAVPTNPQLKPPLLRYHWTAGENCVYLVDCKAESESDIETLVGTIIYTVKETAGDRATIRFITQMGALRRQPKPGKFSSLRFPFDPANFWPGGPFNLPRQLKVDSTGIILEQSGQPDPLPQALGNAEALIFTPLPAPGEKTWDTQTDCVIRQTQHVPPGPGSGFARPEQSLFPARETAAYRLEPMDQAETRILEAYELKTKETVQGEPRMKLTGDGTITFDTTRGVPRTITFTGVFTETTENTTRRTPVTLAYRLLEGTDKTNALTLPALPKVKPKELSVTELRETLIDLQSPNIARRSLAAARLAHATPAGGNPEVVSALLAALHDTEWPVRSDAIRALKVWGGKDAWKPVIEMLNDPQLSVRWAALDTLTKWPSAATATALARHLAAGFDILETGRSLRTLGPVAEDAVDALLGESAPKVRTEACRILEDIGTKKSIPALAAAAGAPDGITASAAGAALQAIQARP